MLRVSSKNHCDVAMRVGDKVIHILASHPTPPAFDGPAGREGPSGARAGHPRRSRDDGPGGWGGGARAPRGPVPPPRRGRDRPASPSLLRLLAAAGASRRGELLPGPGAVLARAAAVAARAVARAVAARAVLRRRGSDLAGGRAAAALPRRRPGAGLRLAAGGAVRRRPPLAGASCGSSTSTTGASTTSPLVACAASTRLGFWPGLGARRSRCSAAWARRSSSSRAMPAVHVPLLGQRPGVVRQPVQQDRDREEGAEDEHAGREEPHFRSSFCIDRWPADWRPPPSSGAGPRCAP